MGFKDIAALVLLAIGGLNWGLSQFLGFNLVTWITSMVGGNLLANGIYGLVGLAALYSIYILAGLFGEMEWWQNLAIILLIVGGLNWIPVIFGMNLISLIGIPIVENIIYLLVTISAVYGLIFLVQD